MQPARQMTFGSVSEVMASPCVPPLAVDPQPTAANIKEVRHTTARRFTTRAYPLASSCVGVCAATVYKLCANGPLQQIRVLNSIRVPDECLRAFIASRHRHRVEPPILGLGDDDHRRYNGRRGRAGAPAPGSVLRNDPRGEP